MPTPFLLTPGYKRGLVQNFRYFARLLNLIWAFKRKQHKKLIFLPSPFFIQNLQISRLFLVDFLGIKKVTKFSRLHGIFFSILAHKMGFKPTKFRKLELPLTLENSTWRYIAQHGGTIWRQVTT